MHSPDFQLPPAGNPIIKHKFTCDPTAIVVDDTIYLFTGHDEAKTGSFDYVMHEWLCFSSTDLVHWTEHVVPLSAADFNWSKGDAYASKVIQHNGKFYWFVATTHATVDGTAIGVAVSDHPQGPYRDSIGSALVSIKELPGKPTPMANLDPAVIIDDKGHVHMWWGNGSCYHSRLTPALDAIDGNIDVIELPGFEEGVHIHKREDKFYLSYGYGMPERVAYAMSDSISGPWSYKGILNEIPGNCQTNRPCIVDFKGNSYFIYHNGALDDGGSFRRSVCIDRLHYNEDGTMQRVVMTSEGILE